MESAGQKIARWLAGLFVVAAVGGAIVLGILVDYGFTRKGVIAAGELLLVASVLFGFTGKVIRSDSTSDPVTTRALRIAAVIICTVLYMVVTAALNPNWRR